MSIGPAHSALIDLLVEALLRLRESEDPDTPLVAEAADQQTARPSRPSDLTQEKAPWLMAD